MTEPQLIVFEGVDAAGKSTVCSEYLACLQTRGIPAKLLSFPGRTPQTLGSLVYTIHHEPIRIGVESLTPLSLQALHIAAHLDAIETLIIPSLEAGQTVILDRFWWSTWVYGTIEGIRSDILQALIEAERLAWGRWQPGQLFLVTRSQPLRPEPPEKWARLMQEYQALARRETGKYPIRILSNEGAITDTVSQALEASHGC